MTLVGDAVVFTEHRHDTGTTLVLLDRATFAVRARAEMPPEAKTDGQTLWTSDEEYAPHAATRDHDEALVDPRWDEAHDVLVEVSARCEEHRDALEREYHDAQVVNIVANVVAGVATARIPSGWGVGPIADRTVLAEANAVWTSGAMSDALDAAYEWLGARRGRQQWSEGDAREWGAQESRLRSLCGG